MPTPFTALESRLNTAVFSRLANVQASVDGLFVSGIFDNEHTLAQYGQIGFESARPMLTCQTSAVPSPAVGAEVSIGADNYTIFAHEPDGTGLSRLTLERA